MKKRSFLAATVTLSALFALAGCGLIPSSLRSKDPAPFAPNDLDRVRPYILENPNYTATLGALGARAAHRTYVTNTSIMVYIANQYNYYIPVGDKLYTFWRGEYGSLSTPEVETEITRASLTKKFTDIFQMDWVWDEASQSYHTEKLADYPTENDTLKIEAESVKVTLSNSLNYFFEDIGRTKVTIPYEFL